MAKKQKREPSGPSNAYLVSFGDTMTALLAFFIVLNSLATEQTGANLYSGTGSFTQVGDSAGVPGLFPVGHSTYPVQMSQPSPLYIVTDDSSNEPDPAANGPDEDGDAPTIQDREQDEFHRFMLEMEKLNKATTPKTIAGEVAFDRMSPLPKTGSLLDEAMKEHLLRFAPAVRRRDYELEIRVWAPTPAPSAWLRAAKQAEQLHAAVIEFLQLRSEQSHKIVAAASPWHSSDVKRPSMSFIVRHFE